MRSLNIFFGTRRIGELIDGDDIWTPINDSTWVIVALSFISPFEKPGLKLAPAE